MIDILKKITVLETQERAGADYTIALVLRAWQAFRFLGPEYEMRVLLQRANHTAIAAHRRSLAHTRLYALTVFVAIEARHYDTANEMLDKAMGYKNYLKNNSPFFYGVMCFLYAYLELSQRRTRSAKKHRRALSDHIKTAEASPHYATMQGLLHLAADELPEAYTYLTDALKAGCNSIFLYEGLFRYYKTAPGSREGFGLLAVLIYAANRGADISAIADKYADTLSAAIAADPDAGEVLYAASKYPPILRDICANRIKNGDLSAEALAFYRDAEQRQIYSPELFDALIRASYENKSPQINRYSLRKFMANAPDFTDANFAVYVYHFLLNDPYFAEIVEKSENKILQLGTHCLREGITGREANSIYFYLWTRFRALGISGADFQKAEDILGENLTLFGLHTRENSAVRFIYVTEPELRRMEVQQKLSGQPIIIEAISENVGCTCLDKAQREIINEEIVITRMVAQAGPELYLHFFRKGDRRFHVLVYLANYYLQTEQPSEDAAPVFEALVKQKGITRQYKMRLLTALGRLHYNAFSFEQALECFAGIDENSIDDYLELLGIYLQTREWERAAKLIHAKHKKIPPETLFRAVQKLLEKSVPENIHILAEVGYYLLVNNFHDDALQKFVLENFRASYSEWAKLSDVTDEDNRTAPALDVRVLECALAMGCFDDHAQKAFARLYSTGENPALLEEFTQLASYEMLANSTRPNYDVLSLLEKIFLSAPEPDVLLAWGLAGVYLRYNITTFKSDEIIKCAISTLESIGLLFPVFKENKQAPNPFIEKFEPFMYKSAPGKNCRLHYRIDGAADYTVVEMEYVRYGIYLAAVPVFYNEQLAYYFSEEMPSGSVTTKTFTVKNTKPFIHENSNDEYFTINNAIIHEQMFKHDQVEKLISGLVKDIRPVRAGLL